MNSTQRVLLALAAASLVAAGCSKISPLAPPTVTGGAASFGTYVAMGTSISSGFESGGLVDRHQTQSFPYLFARQVGSPFTIPSINNDGIPALLQLVSLSPLIVSNAGRVLGNPTNFAQPTAYNNMGIPGAILFDVADTSYYEAGNPIGRPSTMFDIIQRNRGTILAQVASLSPSFISFEYGANEVLGPATQGGTIPVLPSASYGALLDGTLTGLQAACPNAHIAIVNVPDVTSIPYVTTFPPVVLGADGNPVLIGGLPIPLIGSEAGGVGPLGLGDYVLLAAADSMAIGCGFPTGTFSYVSGAPGNNRPLLDSEVLSSVEATAISATVDGYNTAIANEAASRGLALVDLHGLLLQAATTGYSYRGSVYTSDYITGGLFSLDGVHPTDLAHGIICNLMIDAVNRTFGSSISPVNLSESATGSASRVRPVNGRRMLPDIQGSERMLAPLFPWRESALTMR
ncbi:MAG: hypothetical protein ACRENS_03485 [Candidatus Eiseniibacteriota bacterium]